MLERKIEEMQSQNSAHQELKSIILELRNFEDVAKTLRNKLDVLDG